MFKIRAKAKDLTLNFELAQNLPKQIITDQGKLRQVLINLLSNAVKFTTVGGIKLKVHYTQNPESIDHNLRLFFAVEDTGKGIATEEMSNLFAPFYQTQTGIQTQEGTGLGLAISRQFVQLMGGTIQVTSKLNPWGNKLKRI